LISDANKSEQEDKLWQVWKVDYAQMDDKSYVSFDTYLERSFGKKTVKKSDKKVDVKEIIARAEEIKNIDKMSH